MHCSALLDTIKFYFVVISPILISCVFLLNRLKQSEDGVIGLFSKFEENYSKISDKILDANSKKDVNSLLKNLGLTNANQVSIAKEELVNFITKFFRFLTWLFSLLLIGVMIQACIGFCLIRYFAEGDVVHRLWSCLSALIFLISLGLIARLVYFIIKYAISHYACVVLINEAQKDIKKFDEYFDIFASKLK